MGINSRMIGYTAVFGAALTLTGVGCKQTPPPPNDAALTEQVQSRLASDPNLSGQGVQAQVASGVAVLSGTVTSDTARAVAGGDAAQVPGVKTVVNNLTIQSAAAAPPAATVKTAPPPPVHVERERSSDESRRNAQRPSPATPVQEPAPVVRTAPPPPPVQQAQAAPAPPPPPVVRTITLPAGTTIPVRVTQTLDSATTQQGDKFTGAVASDVVADGVVVLPQGTPVTGRVDEVKDATHFAGSSMLSITMTSINPRGERVDVVTEPYSKQGQGRGKNTAEKVGGGAALGAILGGIFGGGKGAAIGTVAGGGLGAGAQAATRGQQVQIPSESIIRFKLTTAVPVRVTPGAANGNDYNPQLQHRNP